MLKYISILSLVILFAACSQSDSHFIESNAQNIAPNTDSLDFLLKKYEENQVLVLAFANHDNYSVYHYLDTLLARLEHDPRLRTLVIERSRDISDFYQQLSVGQTDEVIARYPFASDESKQMTLCGSAEWSYSIANFLPQLRKINRKRAQAGLPDILVKSIDSVDSKKSFFWPMTLDEVGMWPGNSGDFIKRNECGFVARQDGEQPMWTYSENREQETARNFYTDIWQKVKPREKLIVAYHILHTLPGLERCGLYMKSERDWIARRSKMTWFDHFLEIVPGVEPKFARVLLDEKAEFYHPNGVLTVSKDLLESPNRPNDFAVEVAEISTNLSGTDIFESEIFRNSYDVRSNSSLSQMASGILWTSNADTRFPIKSANDYLPNYCEIDNGNPSE